jgi:signal transduction histidine kinase
MRRMLELLNTESDGQASLAPGAGIDRIDELAADITRAGLPVEVRREGQVVDLPPGLDLSVYRIVQEGLTNALKHAGPASAQVRLRYGDAGIEVDVSDDGAGTGPGGGTGSGLAGVRERVAIYGGTITAGPTRDGFRLRAHLPIGTPG